MKYDLVGIGIGPFNLSLAALLAPKAKVRAKFLDDKPTFRWHQELMFGDATMQTSFLKDLVLAVDPTNPYSIINYLVQKGLFYRFLNTNRSTMTRVEFEDYCQWVAKQLEEQRVLEFSSRVEYVTYEKESFVVHTSSEKKFAQHLCVASGPSINIPECAQTLIGDKVFHAKSKYMQSVDLTGKNVVIVGAGQTGLEIFRNALNEKWGRAQSIKLLTGRESLRPLDEGPFTNEIFTPEFVSDFYKVEQVRKEKFSHDFLLASDGNTPSYLQELYNELYLDRYYFKQKTKYNILPMRWLEKIQKDQAFYRMEVKNVLQDKNEQICADIIILATGFVSKFPEYLEGIKHLIQLDHRERFVISQNYQLQTNLAHNQIFAMNFSRHGHGVADPQTSLMSWRSGIVANQILGEEHFSTNIQTQHFLDYFNIME